MHKPTITEAAVPPETRSTELKCPTSSLSGVTMGPMTSELQETRAKLFGTDGSMMLLFVARRGPTRTVVSNVLELVDDALPLTCDNSDDGEWCTMATALHYDADGKFLAELECRVQGGGRDIRLVHPPEAFVAYRVGCNHKDTFVHTDPNMWLAVQGTHTRKVSGNFHADLEIGVHSQPERSPARPGGPWPFSPILRQLARDLEQRQLARDREQHPQQTESDNTTVQVDHPLPGWEAVPPPPEVSPLTVNGQTIGRAVRLSSLIHPPSESQPALLALDPRRQTLGP